MENILILGASSDIGLELIKRIDKSGLSVFAHYNSNCSNLENLSKDLKCSLKLIQADLSNANEVDSLIEGIPCEQIDSVVLLSAPMVESKRLRQEEWDTFQQQIDVSVKAPFLILKKILPAMAKARRGKVVAMLTSYLINTPPSFLSPYIASKSALLGLMRSLAAEFAAKNIQINCVSPSMIETKYLANLPERFLEIASESHPLKRIAKVGDVVPTIEFLLSENSNYMSGANIPITGGQNF